MFDLDVSKLLIVGIAALIFIPPKDLPGVLRQVGQAVGKLRRMAAEFQGQFMDAMKEADLENLKKEISSITDSAKAEVNAISDAARVEINFDPVAETKAELTKAVEAGPPINLPPVPDVPALAIAAAEEGAPKRRGRPRKAEGEAAAPAPENAGDDEEARERIPYRKRVAYSPGRVARAARREG